MLEVVNIFHFNKETHTPSREIALMAIEKLKFKHSSVRDKKFDQLMTTLHSPTDFEFESPSRNEGHLAIGPPTMTFWFHQVKVGLCFPLCSFLPKLSMFYGIPINQLSPSSIRKALFFHIILHKYGIFDNFSHLLPHPRCLYSWYVLLLLGEVY